MWCGFLASGLHARLYVSVCEFESELQIVPPRVFERYPSVLISRVTRGIAAAIRSRTRTHQWRYSCGCPPNNKIHGGVSIMHRWLHYHK